MRRVNRRSFLAASAGATILPLAPDLGFLAPLSRLAAADARLDPARVRLSPGIEALVKLIRSTPRAKVIPVFIDELEAGLSYHDFLAALFHATIEHGDPHQVAGIYSAHRVASESRVEERLLPLFWALDRIARGFEEKDLRKPADLAGALPGAGEAADVLGKAMQARDPEAAERAIVALARARGSRQAMGFLWEHGARRVHGTLGHHPIMAANTWRTLEALGWQHAEAVLRYLARAFPSHESDRTHVPNLERARKTLPALRAGWTAGEPGRGATLELFGVIREGKTDDACDLVCERLASGVKAGALWDAVHLAAADLLFRHRTGGGRIGGYLVHAVTSTNALRFGFDACGEDRARLLLLLQGAAVLGDLFVATARKEDQLRAMSLLDLRTGSGEPAGAIHDVFAMLPRKTNVYPSEESPGDREMSDAASRRAFAHVQDAAGKAGFLRSARSLLCVKATSDPHDLKYPVAAFEDATLVSPEWAPYLLASSVHALHGSASEDSAVLVEAREALR